MAALVLEPLLRDRVAIASLGSADAPATVGVAIWASVNSDADERIRTQIGAGVWPVRLKPEDWTSGESLWLLDVAAPSRLHASAVLIGFGKVAGNRRSDKAMTAVRVFMRVVASLAAVTPLAACSDILGDQTLPTYRYRVMVEVDTPEGVRRGAS
eukprot:gene46302-59477_t